MKYYLDGEKGTFKTFDYFDRELIRSAILEHLKSNPDSIVEFSRGYDDEKDNKKYFPKVIDIYEVNPRSGKPSLIIQKGNKTFYKSLI